MFICKFCQEKTKKKFCIQAANYYILNSFCKNFLIVFSLKSLFLTGFLKCFTHFYQQVTSTHNISGRAFVLTGGPQVPTPGETKI